MGQGCGADLISFNAKAKPGFSCVRRLNIKTTPVSSLIVNSDGVWLINTAANLGISHPLVGMQAVILDHNHAQSPSPGSFRVCRIISEFVAMATRTIPSHCTVSTALWGISCDVRHACQILLQPISAVYHVGWWQITSRLLQRRRLCPGCMIKLPTPLNPTHFPPTPAFSASCATPWGNKVFEVNTIGFVAFQCLNDGWIMALVCG